jgi:phage gp46-like protein
MTDIRIAQIASEEAVTLDFLLTPIGDLDTSHELATAVTVALCTDARAQIDDELPDPDSDDRRGWWADSEAEQIWGAWPIGSRLWLLERTKITGPGARAGSTIARVESYIRDALAPFREKKIVSRIVVRAEHTGIESIGCVVSLYRGPRQLIELRYQTLWEEPRTLEQIATDVVSLIPPVSYDDEDAYGALVLGTI